MHKLYSTKAGGGRRELKLGALHKRGAAYERHDERGARGIRRAEGHSERGLFSFYAGNHNQFWHTGKICTGVLSGFCAIRRAKRCFAEFGVQQFGLHQWLPSKFVKRRRHIERYGEQQQQSKRAFGLPRHRLTVEASA